MKTTPLSSNRVFCLCVSDEGFESPTLPMKHRNSLNQLKESTDKFLVKKTPQFPEEFVPRKFYHFEVQMGYKN